VIKQISFVSQAPTFTVQIDAIQKRGGIEVRETDTVAFLFYKCCVFYRRYAASCDLKVYKNGVDLATLDQESTLADVDINGTTKLHAKADAGNTIDIRCPVSFSVKDLIGREIPFTHAQSYW
jgi:hypothetical protein